MLRKAETSHDILETGIFRVQPLAVFLEIRQLSRQTHVENERERVNRGIRRRVERIHLIVFAIGDADAVHTASDTTGPF